MSSARCGSARGDHRPASRQRFEYCIGSARSTVRNQDDVGMRKKCGGVRPRARKWTPRPGRAANSEQSTKRWRYGPSPTKNRWSDGSMPRMVSNALNASRKRSGASMCPTVMNTRSPSAMPCKARKSALEFGVCGMGTPGRTIRNFSAANPASSSAERSASVLTTTARARSKSQRCHQMQPIFL